ncbi:MAG: L,D-transpeptidase family protein [Myxococcaceae bacterium]|nr:L,D-transpeptidase family protein [Myxococcaceae bacterium]
MPVNSATAAGRTEANAAASTTPGLINTAAFIKNPQLTKIAAGTAPSVSKGGPKTEHVKTVQLALFSLGILETRSGVDGSFGPKTETALKAFQAKAGISQTGQIDSATVRALDNAALAQITELKRATLPVGSRRDKYKLIADISDSGDTRLYVMGPLDKIEARYLISPGTARYPTLGDGFVITEVLPRQPWNPPASDWARNARQIPAGLDNPMGILKLNLGRYSQYVHGVPFFEEDDLGRAASHGCVRMSGSNILEAHEKWAEAGTHVSINRDREISAELQTKFDATGLSDRPVDAGRQYLFGYVSGELGTVQRYTAPRA